MLSHTSLCPLRGRQDSLQHARCGWIMSYCWHHTNHRLNPAGQKSVLLLQCGQRQSSYTPNSTAARRRNWRRRPYSSCSPASRQTLRQQGGRTGEDGHIHLADWTLDVTAIEKMKNCFSERVIGWTDSLLINTEYVRILK